MANNRSRQQPNSDFRLLDSPSGFPDDDNRIDWDRRSRKTRSEDVVDDLVSEVESVDGVEALLEIQPGKRRGKKNHRKKRRHFVLDEERGQVIVQRRRKNNRRYDDWQEEYE
jgi:hypothetical protein